MPDQAAILLLTRPEQQSQAFHLECEHALGRKIPVVVSPVLKIAPIENSVDLSSYGTLILSSTNAVRRMGTRLQGHRVVTVGQETAKAARSFGANAQCLGDTAASLLERVASIAPPALHLRGVHSRGCIADRLSERGVSTNELVVYDQVEQPLNAAGKAALMSGAARVPVFSPRSAALLSSYGAHPDTFVFAISPSAADAWRTEGEIKIAREPNRAALRDLVIGSF